MFTFDLLIFIVIGLIVIALTEKFTTIIPRSLFFLVAGVILSTLGIVTPTGGVEIIASIAIVFLLFSAELPHGNVVHFFKAIVRNIRISIIAAIGPWIGAFTFSIFFGWSFEEAIILGAVFTATALAFTIGVLRSLQLERTDAAKSAITASATDSVIAGMIGMFTSIAVGSSIAHGSSEINPLIEIFLIFLFFAFLFLLHNVFVKFRLLRLLPPHPLILLLVGGVIIYIGGYFFGIHYAIAALLAGVLLHEEIFSSKNARSFSAAAEQIGVASRYIGPFFFIFLGLHLSLKEVIEHPLIIGASIGLFISVATLQFATASFAGAWRGLNHRNATVLGFAMLPRDIVAIVVLEMNKEFISNDMIVPVVIMTIFFLNVATAFGLVWCKKHYWSTEKK